MGTRGIYGFRKNNKDKITFCNSDSFFEGLGKEIVDFIRKTDIKIMSEIYDRIILVDIIQEATEEQIKKCKKYLNIDVNIRTPKDFTCLLWKSIGSLKAYRDDNLEYMIDASREITNPHLCEYIYIIDLDTNELEIYAEIKEEIIKDRYNKELSRKEKRCGLIKKYKLNNIPDNWIEECDKICEDSWKG